MTALEARAIAQWRYRDEYSFYDIPASEAESVVRSMTDPEQRFFAAYDGEDFIGFCSIGFDGRVPGGAYDESATDIGAGLRPDLVGKHHGMRFLRAVVEFARREIGGGPLRATIASWNVRALAAAMRVGFVVEPGFVGSDGTRFTVLRRPDRDPDPA